MAICIRFVPTRQIYSFLRNVNMPPNSNESNDIEMNKSLVEIKQRIYVFTTFLLKNTLSAKQLNGMANWKGELCVFAIISEVNGNRIEWLQSAQMSKYGRGKEMKSSQKTKDFIQNQTKYGKAQVTIADSAQHQLQMSMRSHTTNAKSTKKAPYSTRFFLVPVHRHYTLHTDTGHFISFDCLFGNKKIFFSCVASTERSIISIK